MFGGRQRWKALSANTAGLMLKYRPVGAWEAWRCPYVGRVGWTYLRQCRGELGHKGTHHPRHSERQMRGAV